MSDKILVLSPISATAVEHLKQNYDPLFLYDSDDPNGLIANNQESISVLVAGHKSKVSSSFIERLTALELICAPLPAIRHIEIDEHLVKEKNIQIVPLGSMPADDYVEMTLGLLLSLTKRIVEINMMFRTGHWRSSTKRLGYRLHGKKAAIFGDVTVKNKLSDTLASLKVDVLDNKGFSSFEAVAAEADLFIILPGLEIDRNRKVGREVFENIGKNGIFVCLGSFACVNVEDLQIALSNKTIKGAAMDIYSQVEDVPEALLSMDNVILTPSVSGMTLEAFHDMGHSVIEAIDDYFKR